MNQPTLKEKINYIRRMGWGPNVNLKVSVHLVLFGIELDNNLSFFSL